jgi:hypothetical protein
MIRVIKSMIGWLPIFAQPKSRHANKIWLSLDSYLKSWHFNICDKIMAKLLETS